MVVRYVSYRNLRVFSPMPKSGTPISIHFPYIYIIYIYIHISYIILCIPYNQAYGSYGSGVVQVYGNGCGYHFGGVPGISLYLALTEENLR